MDKQDIDYSKQLTKEVEKAAGEKSGASDSADDDDDGDNKQDSEAAKMAAMIPPNQVEIMNHAVMQAVSAANDARYGAKPEASRHEKRKASLSLPKHLSKKARAWITHKTAPKKQHRKPKRRPGQQKLGSEQVQGAGLFPH